MPGPHILPIMPVVPVVPVVPVMSVAPVAPKLVLSVLSFLPIPQVEANSVTLCKGSWKFLETKLTDIAWEAH